MRDAFASDPKLVAATASDARLRPSRAAAGFSGSRPTNTSAIFCPICLDADGHLAVISGARGVPAAGSRRGWRFDPACLVEDYELIRKLRRCSVVSHRGWTTSVVGASRALTVRRVGRAFLRQRRRWFGAFCKPNIGIATWWAIVPLAGSACSCSHQAADTLQPIYGLTAFALLHLPVTGRFVLVNPVIA